MKRRPFEELVYQHDFNIHLNSVMVSVLLRLLAVAGAVQAYTVTNVDFLMFKNIDPVVMPGKYKSHLHSFFGSDAVNVTTATSAELQRGCSTAVNPNDFSIYCTSPNPTLHQSNAD